MTQISQHSKFARGAEWRKWDLHVHTPGTLKEDKYEGESIDEKWQKFCESINSDRENISVIGVTDYLLLDNYQKFVQLVEEGKITKKFDLILPNIELRITPVTGGGRALNLHIIVDPEFVDQLGDRIYSKLSMKSGGGTTYDASRGNLIRLGKSINSKLSDNDAYKEGARKFVADFDSLQTVFDNDPQLKEYCVIVVSNSSNDGASGVTQHSDFLEDNDSDLDIKRQSIYKFADAIFSSNPKDREYFLGKGIDKEKVVIQKCSSLKPCIHGCDAHTNSRLFNPDHDRFCWIKADPTFEGLKQITYEPESRVFIGIEPEVEDRVRENKTKYIESVFINQKDDYDDRHGEWFKDIQIPLNKELVAVVGNKGSGKSALTDIIGLVGNSHNKLYGPKKEELFSFLNKEKFLKNNLASNFYAKLKWFSKHEDQVGLDSDTNVNISEKIEYLPQKYLERICSNIDHEDFRQKLNEVIFGYVKKEERYQKENLDELLSYLTEQSKRDVDILKDDLHQQNEKVVSIEKKLTEEYKHEVLDKKKQKQSEIDAHETNKPKEIVKPEKSEGETEEMQNRLDRLNKDILEVEDNIQKSETELTQINSDIEELTQVKRAVERQKLEISGIHTKYKDLLESNDIRFEEVIDLSIDFEKIDVVITTKQERGKELKMVLIDPEEIEDPTLGEKSLLKRLKDLNKKKKKITDGMEAPDRLYHAYIKSMTEWEARKKQLTGTEVNPKEDTLNWYTTELLHVENEYPSQLKAARETRKSIVQNIFKKKKEFVLFYNKIKSSIDSEIEKYKKELENYDIAIGAGIQIESSFENKFFDFISQSVKGSFQGRVEGEESLYKICDRVEDWGNEDQVVKFLNNLQQHLDVEKEKGVFAQLKRGYTAVDLYDYVYSLDYIKTKYDLKVDDKDLSELSPGERGGLLLIFYLMLDRREIPLVIDQPEDNLDNGSIYQILVTFLKKAKLRRQIIIVTHNPNLAVVADAEQIIYVSIDKKDQRNKYSFYSGSIENPIINKKVIDILEGTRPAFDNRRLKYRKH